MANFKDFFCKLYIFWVTVWLHLLIFAFPGSLGKFLGVYFCRSFEFLAQGRGSNMAKNKNIVSLSERLECSGENRERNFIKCRIILRQLSKSSATPGKLSRNSTETRNYLTTMVKFSKKNPP